MFKGQITSRTFYRENPMTAVRPVMGTQITILAFGNGGPCLIGDSQVKWDETIKKTIDRPPFNHNEMREYSEQEATQIFGGKVSKLIADGYVFEAVPDMHHFITTGQWVIEVHQHPTPPQGVLNPR